MPTRELSARLTAGRKKIFVKHIWGRFQKIRWTSFSFFLSLYLLLPFVRWGDRPLILFDLPSRKFHLGPLTVWPQEFYLLTFVLIFAAIALFASTSVVGRMWCGYLCPQTVLTSLFMEIERRVEGDKAAQERLAKGPWSPDKIRKFALKNGLWLVVAMVLGFTFVSYFVPNQELLGQLLTGQASPPVWFWFGFITLAAFADGGYFREQTCQVPCPYGRFQGSMFDPNSLLVAYNEKRGEPRAFYKKTETREAGDCVDCKLCVQVCPTGLDIRDGIQYECIQCARCIDACDSVMGKLGFGQGLIQYTSHNAKLGLPTRILRPRLGIYALILSGILGFIVWRLAATPPVALDIIRNRTLMFREMAGDRVSNMYTVKVLNKSNQDHTYILMVEGLPATVMTGQNPFTVRAGDIYQASATVVVNRQSLKSASTISDIRFVLREVGHEAQRAAVTEGTFMAPPHLSQQTRREVGG